MSIVIFVFGLLTGSFLNAVIHRFHSGESMMEKHSRCARCGHALSALDLIPLVSFFALAGKCRYCKKSISWIYPLVELATAAAFVLVFVNGLEIIDYRLLFKFTFVSFLIVIFVYDFKHYLILDKVVLPALAAAMLFQLMQGNLLGGAIGSIALGGFFFVLHVISKGKWIGFGDVKLGLFLGMLAGWPETMVTFFLAYFLGALFAVPLLLLKQKKLADKLPFGTFLTFSAFIAMIWGEGSVQWYFRIIGI